MANDRLSIRVDAELQQELEDLARETGQSESDLVRDAIRRHVRSRHQRENAFDLAMRLGIVGSAKGLPRDLSTNPKHMEGFGQ